MEKEGLVRCMEELEKNSIIPTLLTTDGHTPTAAYMAKSWPGVKHFQDA